MIHFRQALTGWGTDAFGELLKAEVERLPPSELPLQQALSRTSYVADVPHRATVLGANERGDQIVARVGIFFGGIVAGCNCADDPSPVDVENEYCKVQIAIDKRSGVVRITAIEE